MANDKNYESGLFRYDEGVLHKMARDDYYLPCRSCGNTVVEASGQCRRCGIYAPGIYSECPTCGSKNYTWKPYGRNNSAMLGGLILGGPIGAVIGAALGSNDAECVCLNCGQGWTPFGMVGGWLSTTRKFKLQKAPQQKKQVSSGTLRQNSTTRQSQQSHVQQSSSQTHSNQGEKEGSKGIGSIILGIVILIFCASLVVNGINDAKEEKKQKEQQMEQERLLAERKEEQLHNNELSDDEYTDVNEMEYLSAIQTAKNMKLVVDHEVRNDLDMEFLNISCPTKYGLKIYYFEDFYPNLKNLRTAPDFLNCKNVTIVNLEEDGKRVLGIHSNVLSADEIEVLMDSLLTVFKGDEIDAKKVLGCFTSTMDFLDNKYKNAYVNSQNSQNAPIVEETLAKASDVYLEDWYEMLSKGYSFEDVKDKYKVEILSEFDTLLEFYGNFGEYKGYVHYNTKVPIYGLEGEYMDFSWTSVIGTQCPDEYLLSRYNLEYIDSGYHNDAKVTLYNWEDKLILSVLQSNKEDSSGHTLIQAILYDEYVIINYW